MQKVPRTDYAITLDALERSARVPLYEQLTSQDEAPPPGPLAPQELDRQLLLGVTGAGSLRIG